MQAGAECTHFTSEVVLFRALLRQKFDLIFIDLDVAPTPDDLGTPIMLTSREFGLAWMFFSLPGAQPSGCGSPRTDLASVAATTQSVCWEIF